MSPPLIGNKSQGAKYLPCRPKGTVATSDKNYEHLHTTDAITIKTGIFSNFVSILISILVGRLEGTGGRERRFSGRGTPLASAGPGQPPPTPQPPFFLVLNTDPKTAPANVCPRSGPRFKLFMAYPDLSPSSGTSPLLTPPHPRRAPITITITITITIAMTVVSITETSPKPGRPPQGALSLNRHPPQPPSSPQGTWDSHKKELCQLDRAGGFLYPPHQPLFPTHPLLDGLPGHIWKELPFVIITLCPFREDSQMKL